MIASVYPIIFKPSTFLLFPQLFTLSTPLSVHNDNRDELLYWVCPCGDSLPNGIQNHSWGLHPSLPWQSCKYNSYIQKIWENSEPNHCTQKCKMIPKEHKNRPDEYWQNQGQLVYVVFGIYKVQKYKICLLAYYWCMLEVGGEESVWVRIPLNQWRFLMQCHVKARRSYMFNRSLCPWSLNTEISTLNLHNVMTVNGERPNFFIILHKEIIFLN